MADYTNTQIVSKPVDLKAVCDLLGETSYDDITACSSTAINMWARYKPFQYPAAKFAQDEEGSTATDHDDALESKNCGLKLYNTLPGNMFNVYDGTLNGWSYLRPLGGTVAPYRLGDFIGYKHDAAQPFGFMSINYDSNKVINVNSTIRITATAVEDSDGKNLTFNDLGSIKNGSFYVIFKNGNTTKTAPAKRTVAQSGGLMSISVAASTIALSTTGSDETWQVAPYIQVTSDSGITCYTIPYLNTDTITISKDQAAYVEIKALKTSTALTSGVVTLFATNQVIKLTNAVIFLRFQDKTWTDALVQGEHQIPLADTTYTGKEVSTSLYKADAWSWDGSPTISAELLANLAIWFSGTVNGTYIRVKAVAMWNQDE